MLTNPSVQKDGFTQSTVWCWGNWMSPKVRNMQSKEQSLKSHVFCILCQAHKFMHQRVKNNSSISWMLFRNKKSINSF